MNELEKAKVILDNDDLSDYHLSNLTGINRKSIWSYWRKDIKLENVKWIIIHKLAKYYDENYN